MRKSSVSYAPRGVVRKQIALRLLAPELAKHETLANQSGSSSAAFARQMYLRGVRSFERAAVAPGADSASISTSCGVNRA
jgi:hypothetical protein